MANIDACPGGMTDFGVIPEGLRCKCCGTEIERTGITACDYRQREERSCYNCVKKRDDFWIALDRWRD